MAITYNEALNAGGWKTGQKLLLGLAMLIVLLDGFDTQLLGIALPAIMADWGISRASIAPVLAASTVGAVIGAFSSGFLSDRFGRKRALLANIMIVGSGNLWSSFAPDIGQLGASRALSGFGLGGILVCIAALVAEFTPIRKRPVALALCGICMPVGGLIASLGAAWLVADGDWSRLFTVGAILPLSVMPIIWRTMPESPVFLGRWSHRRSELDRTLDRLGVARDVSFAEERTDKRGGGARFIALLDRDWRFDTVAVWIAYFCCIITIYCNLSWLPTLFVQEGFSLAEGARALAGSVSGAIIGSVSAAVLLKTVGSRVSLTILPAMGGVLAMVMIFLFRTHAGVPALMVGITGLALCFSLAQTTFYALIGSMYDDTRRAIGSSSAYGIGRLGSLASAFTGAIALGFGAVGYFSMIVGLAAIILLAMLRFGRHTAPATAG